MDSKLIAQMLCNGQARAGVQDQKTVCNNAERNSTENAEWLAILLAGFNGFGGSLGSSLSSLASHQQAKQPATLQIS